MSVFKDLASFTEYATLTAETAMPFDDGPNAAMWRETLGRCMVNAFTLLTAWHSGSGGDVPPAGVKLSLRMTYNDSLGIERHSYELGVWDAESRCFWLDSGAVWGLDGVEWRIFHE